MSPLRRLPLLLLLAALAAPFATAASFTLLAERHLEQDAGRDGVTVFAMPVQVNSGGFVYAKLLATEDNAVHDGYEANGSVEARTGWRVAFAWVRADGAREELGTFVDGTPTATVPVQAGETSQLVVTVRWPGDAQTVGGATQKVWVALAYRATSDGAQPGATSGVSMDEARAMSLTLRFAEGVAMAPAGQNVPPPSSTPTPATPAAPTSGTPAAPTTPGASQETPDGTGGVPPVGPISESTSPVGETRVVLAPLPTWFLASMVGIGALAVAALALVGVGLVLVARRPRARARLRRSVPVPVRESAPKDGVEVGRGR